MPQKLDYFLEKSIKLIYRNKCFPSYSEQEKETQDKNKNEHYICEGIIGMYSEYEIVAGHAEWLRLNYFLFEIWGQKFKFYVDTILQYKVYFMTQNYNH